MLKLIVLMVLLQVVILGSRLLLKKILSPFRILGSVLMSLLMALGKRNWLRLPVARVWVSHRLSESWNTTY